MTWDEVEEYLQALGFQADDDATQVVDELYELADDDPWRDVDLAHAELTDAQREFLAAAGLVDDAADDAESQPGNPDA